MEGANSRGEVDVAKNDLQRKVRSNDMSIKFTELVGKSEILIKFMRVECDGDSTMYAACKTCLVLVKYASDSGTSGLKRHTCKANSGKNQPSIASFIKRKFAVRCQVSSDRQNCSHVQPRSQTLCCGRGERLYQRSTGAARHWSQIWK